MIIQVLHNYKFEITTMESFLWTPPLIKGIQTLVPTEEMLIFSLYFFPPSIQGTLALVPSVPLNGEFNTHWVLEMRHIKHIYNYALLILLI